jgi:hypothetical protein
MMISATLRHALASRVVGLIEFAGGNAARVAEQLGTPEWRVGQLVAGVVDPTLGEVARVASLQGSETLASFMYDLLDDQIAYGSRVHRARA